MSHVNRKLAAAVNRDHGLLPGGVMGVLLLARGMHQCTYYVDDATGTPAALNTTRPSQHFT